MSIRYLGILILPVIMIGCISPGEDVSAAKVEIEHAETRLDAKVEASISALSTEVTQKIDSAISSQNIGMFSGGGIYVLLLAMFVILVIAAAGIALVVIVLRARRSQLISDTLISSVNKYKSDHKDDARPLLNEIEKQSQQVGVHRDLNRILAHKGTL